MTEPPARRATLRQLAQAAGVSIASASYAVNGTGSLSPSSRAHILEVAARLNYRPNTLARAMRSGRVAAIGVIVPDLANPFFGELIQAVSQAARAQGVDVLIADSEGAPEQERRLAGLLVDGGVAGLIWFPIREADGGRLLQTAPTVVLDRRLLGYDLVLADYAKGGELAADHLMALGHRKIGIVSGPLDAWSARERAEASKRRIAARAELAWFVEAAYSIDLDGSVVAALERRDASAVIAGNDLIALAVIEKLRSMGLQVPKDVSVTGFDDIGWARLVTPSLTTVGMPVEEMGAAAVELLLERMAQPSREVRCSTLPVSLVTRGSTGRAPQHTSD